MAGLDAYDKVAWYEGMLLKPQHFQQQERFLLHSIKGLWQSSGEYNWGFLNISFDRQRLADGELSIQRCDGILKDGTPFSLNDKNVVPICVTSAMSGDVVYLRLPNNSKLSMSESSKSGNTFRFHVQEVEVDDDVVPSKSGKKSLMLGRCRFYLSLGTSKSESIGYSTLPIARIKQVIDKKVFLDEKDFFPPSLSIKQMDGLENQLLGELRVALDRSILEHAQWINRTPERNAKQIDALLSLQAMNRFKISLWRQSGRLIEKTKSEDDSEADQHTGESNWHPYQFYSELLTLLSDLSTTRLPSRTAEQVKPYKHDDLERSLIPLRDKVIDLIKLPLDLDVQEIPMTLKASTEEHSGYFVEEEAFLLLKKLVSEKAKLFLAVKIPQNKTTSFVNQCLVSSSAVMREVLRGGMSGIRLEPKHLPNGIDKSDEPCGFLLDHLDPMWQIIQNSEQRGVFFHIKSFGNMRELDLRLWAVKNLGVR